MDIEQMAEVGQPAIPAADPIAAPVDPSAAIPPEGQEQQEPAPVDEYRYYTSKGEKYRDDQALLAAAEEKNRYIDFLKTQNEQLLQFRGSAPPPQAPVDPYQQKFEEYQSRIAADPSVETLAMVLVDMQKDTVGAVQKTFKVQQEASAYESIATQYPYMSMDNPASRYIGTRIAPDVNSHFEKVTTLMQHPEMAARYLPPDVASEFYQYLQSKGNAQPAPPQQAPPSDPWARNRTQQFASLRQPVSTGAAPRPVTAPAGPPPEHVERYIASRLERDARATPEQQKQWAESYRQRWTSSPYNNGQVTR